MVRNLRLVIICLNLCIATTAPALAQNTVVDVNDQNSGALIDALVFGTSESHKGVLGFNCAPGKRPPDCPIKTGPVTSTTGEGIISRRTPGVNQYGLDFFTADAPRLSITSGGFVGIGTTAPTTNLDVESSGDVTLLLRSTSPGGGQWALKSDGTSNGARLEFVDQNAGKTRFSVDSTGLASVNALQITGGSDIAEPFDVDDELTPGSVVVIDDNRPGRLRLSTTAYDRKVAGIVSGAGGIGIGLKLVQLGDERHQDLVALSGRVYALAEASGSPIVPGDLLTTSARPGRLMKAEDDRLSRGAIVGKAMTRLDQGEGLVLILVDLQ